MEDSHHATEKYVVQMHQLPLLSQIQIGCGQNNKVAKTFGTKKITGISNIKITAGKLNSHGSCICLRLNFSILYFPQNVSFIM